MNKELKPCPFCGGRAAVVESSPVYLAYRVRCRRCGAETGMYTTAINAVRCWNDREERMCKPIWTEDGYACNKCGYWWPLKHYDNGKPHYCPNCGAKVVDEKVVKE